MNLKTKTNLPPSSIGHNSYPMGEFLAVDYASPPNTQDQAPPILDMELIEQARGCYNELPRAEGPAATYLAAVGHAAIAAANA